MAAKEAGLVKHKLGLHPLNSKSIWYNKTRYKIHIIQYTVHNIKGRIKQCFVSVKLFYFSFSSDVTTV